MFFNISYFREYNEPIKSLHLEKMPGPFGIVTDIYGKQWHLNGQIGKYLLAAPLNQVDELWGSTRSDISPGLHQQEWLPYEVVLAGKT